ncbi:hypothetical protein GCM10010244_46370 [Streptomyces coeruleorubidus]|nr:hypothetical protein GCM10010244_46370 [Streptomyces bellus]
MLDAGADPEVFLAGSAAWKTPGGATGQFPCLAVVAVTGQRPADGDDEPGVGVDDDLVVHSKYPAP